ncbi:MAG: hypothetical protein M9958_00400 [Chitinophagales bacterium]|nr:hypothetical protein [Chitinophagales bacterium]
MKEKYTEISERLNLLLKALNENPNSFSKALGYGRSQVIYDLLSKKAAPSFDFFYKIYNSEFSETINIRWIITGRGEMLLSSESSTHSPSSAEFSLSDRYVLVLEELNECRKTLDELRVENQELKERLSRSEK